MWSKYSHGVGADSKQNYQQRKQRPLRKQHSPQHIPKEKIPLICHLPSCKHKPSPWRKIILFGKVFHLGSSYRQRRRLLPFSDQVFLPTHTCLKQASTSPSVALAQEGDLAMWHCTGSQQWAVPSPEVGLRGDASMYPDGQESLSLIMHANMPLLCMNKWKVKG